MNTVVAIACLMTRVYLGIATANTQSTEPMLSYLPENLYYDHIEISDVMISNIITYFDPNRAEQVLLTSPFTVSIPCLSKVVEEVIVKIFCGPRLDDQGNLLGIVNMWMDFVKIDSFTYRIATGDNLIERSSDDMPQRVKIPRGTADGYSVRFFVILYPSSWNTSLEFPLDRPVSGFFVLPNMFFENTEIYEYSRK